MIQLGGGPARAVFAVTPEHGSGVSTSDELGQLLRPVPGHDRAPELPNNPTSPSARNPGHDHAPELPSDSAS